MHIYDDNDDDDDDDDDNSSKMRRDSGHTRDIWESVNRGKVSG